MAQVHGQDRGFFQNVVLKRGWRNGNDKGKFDGAKNADGPI